MLVLLFVVALTVVAAAFWFRNDLNKIVPAQLALNVTPTRVLTRTPVTIFLVATSVPATPTHLPPPSALPNTAAPSPTAAPTATFPPTRTVSNQGTRVPPATGTPSPIPTVIPVPAPKLVSPTDGERIIGANKRVDLQFQPAKPLGALDWFRVQVDFLDRAGNAVSWCGFTKNSSQEFPHDFFDDSSPTLRSFLWRVNVVRSNQITPSTCDAPYDILGPSSEPWTFYWY